MNDLATWLTSLTLSLALFVLVGIRVKLSFREVCVVLAAWPWFIYQNTRAQK